MTFILLRKFLISEELKNQTLMFFVVFFLQLCPLRADILASPNLLMISQIIESEILQYLAFFVNIVGSCWTTQSAYLLLKRFLFYFIMFCYKHMNINQG